MVIIGILLIVCLILAFSHPILSGMMIGGIVLVCIVIFANRKKSPTVDDAYKKSYGLPLKPKKRSSILEYNVSDEYPNDFTVVDLETTGLDVEYDEIVQIAAIKFKGGVEEGRFMSYVKPTIHIPTEASKIHYIYDSTVENAPNIQEVLTRFMQYIGSSTLIAHNASFDMKFLQTFLACNEMNLLTNPVVDTLSLARSFLNLPNYKLPTIKDYYGINVQSHEGLADCLVCAKLYLDYLNYENPTYDEITDEIYKCFIDDTGDPIPDTMRNIIEKVCGQHSGKCYKTSAKSAKYAIISNTYNQNGRRLKLWHDKGFKVTTMEAAMKYWNLI